jgi:hypothetical protein
LKNLPKEYKLGKRETPLGTLLYVRKKIKTKDDIA